MASKLQQARDVFQEAEITPGGEDVNKLDEVIEEANVDDIEQDEELENVDGAEDGDAEDDGEVDGEQEDLPEAAESYTVDSLAEAIGFETSDLYNMLKIPMKDGQDPISLGDIKTTITDVNRENDTLKTQLTDMQGQLEMAKSGGPVGINNEIAQGKAYIQQLQASLASPEMLEMKDIDPTRYLIESGDIDKNIQQVYNYMNQLNQKQQIDNKAMLESFDRKYVELIPSWEDNAVKAKDQGVMTEYMKSKGFGMDEINKMADPRIQVVVKELIDLRKEKQAATEAVQKVRKAPKVLSHTRKAPKINKGDKTNALINKAKRSNNKADTLNAARALMNGG